MENGNEIIFIQTPDDMELGEQDEILRYLNIVGKQMDPHPYQFVLAPIGYKAMDGDEINELLNHLLEAATA